jgi:NAD dependent epimerase/dehydratase family enzyme
VHRPALLFVPGAALQIALGEFAGEIRRSQRVIPAVLERAGFRFTHSDVDSALRDALGTEPVAPR